MDVCTETTTECLASLLRRQGLKTSGKVFWSEFNILGFVLSLVWIPKLGSGSNSEEGEHLSTSMDSVSRRRVTSTISLWRDKLSAPRMPNLMSQTWKSWLNRRAKPRSTEVVSSR